jgi:hypothetical protein
VSSDPLSIVAEEKIRVVLSNNGGLEELEINGTIFLQVVLPPSYHPRDVTRNNFRKRAQGAGLFRGQSWQHAVYTLFRVVCNGSMQKQSRSVMDPPPGH